VPNDFRGVGSVSIGGARAAMVEHGPRPRKLMSRVKDFL